MNNSSFASDIESLTEKVHTAQIPSELSEKVLNQINRVGRALEYGGNINQLDIVTNYIEWIISLPWERKTPDSLDITTARKIMDKNHHGLNDIKQRIIEYLSVLILQKQKPESTTQHAPVLFFVGLSGTGKTTFAHSVAETMGCNFIRIPFGGISRAADLRGMSKVQPDAEPGVIIKSLRRANSRNPVILLDEIDRISPESRGEIMGVLIELLDPEQNAGYIDHYIDFPFDLSQVIFIATANNTNNISTAVMDRLEVINMPSYSDEEKIIIGKDYIFPRLLNESGLTAQNVSIDDIIWRKLAREAGYDPGVRSVERKIETIVRRIAYKIVKGDGVSFTINESNEKEYLE